MISTDKLFLIVNSSLKRRIHQNGPNSFQYSHIIINLIFKSSKAIKMRERERRATYSTSNNGKTFRVGTQTYEETLNFYRELAHHLFKSIALEPKKFRVGNMLSNVYNAVFCWILMLTLPKQPLFALKSCDQKMIILRNALAEKWHLLIYIPSNNWFVIVIQSHSYCISSVWYARVRCFGRAYTIRL